MGKLKDVADRLRVFLVDDHGLFVEGLSLLLSAQAGDVIEVVGHSTRPEEAVSHVSRRRPWTSR